MKSYLSLLLALVSVSAFAQSVDTKINFPSQKLEAAPEQAWKFGLDVGLTTSWGYDQKFVGVADGHYLNLGGKVTGRALWAEGPHRWRNTLSVLETFSKTPALDAILKAADQLNFESLYTYNIEDWWGAFGQFNLDSAIFEGKDVRASPVTYTITALDGSTTNVVGSELVLTDAFKPLYLRQAVGLFATPVKGEALTWEVRAALSARETFAKDQLIVSSSTATTVAVSTLSNFYQLGPALGTSVTGLLFDKRVGYKAGIDAMYVAYRSSDIVLSSDFSNRVNVEAYAGLSFKLVDWASLTWDFKALRLPEITTDLQLQSNLLLTLSYSI